MTLFGIYQTLSYSKLRTIMQFQKTNVYNNNQYFYYSLQQCIIQFENKTLPFHILFYQIKQENYVMRIMIMANYHASLLFLNYQKTINGILLKILKVMTRFKK